MSSGTKYLVSQNNVIEWRGLIAFIQQIAMFSAHPSWLPDTTIHDINAPVVVVANSEQA